MLPSHLFKMTKFLKELKPNNSQLALIELIALILIIRKVSSSLSGVKKLSWKLVKETLGNAAVPLALQLPIIGDKVDELIREKITKDLKDMKEKSDLAKADPIRSLPKTAMPLDEIRALFPKFEDTVKKGHMSGGIYSSPSPELTELLKDIYGETNQVNPLHPIFKDMEKKESELIEWCRQLLEAPEGTHGIITSGGTQSIFEAMKAYVELARKKGIERPEIIIPSSAHPAFDKAAKILNAKLVVVPVNEETGKADPAAMKAAITKNTAVMCASGMTFGYGVMDPIDEIAQIALDNKIPCHVDNCLGGFLTAFLKKAGYTDIPVPNFSHPGVTSMSADIHKYGNSPKGASILLIKRDAKELIKFATPNYTNLTSSVGAYVTPGVPGSRSGTVVASAYAVMLATGEDGYVKMTRDILNLRAKLQAEINKVDGLYVAFDPKLAVVGVRAKPDFDLNDTPAPDAKDKQKPRPLDIVLVSERMKSKGWLLNDLLNENGRAEGFHFCLTSAHTSITEFNFVEKFCDDLRDSIQYIKAHPEFKATGTAAAYTAFETGEIPPCLFPLIGQVVTEIRQSLPGVPIPGFFPLPNRDKEPEQVPAPAYTPLTPFC